MPGCLHKDRLRRLTESRLSCTRYRCTRACSRCVPPPDRRRCPHNMRISRRGSLSASRVFSASAPLVSVSGGFSPLPGIAEVASVHFGLLDKRRGGVPPVGNRAGRQIIFCLIEGIPVCLALRSAGMVGVLHARPGDLRRGSADESPLRIAPSVMEG